MSELEEIMDGKHEIKHLQIEGDTIAFETELNNHTWNLTPRNIEVIISCLQQELQQKENIIKEVREYIESYMPNYDFDKTNLLKILEILDKGE